MTDLTTPAPIVGTKGITTIEGQVAAAGTAGIALLGTLIAILYPADMGIFTEYAPIAASVIAFGLALSRSITKVGVVHALAIQAAALAQNAPQVIHTVSEVDPHILEQLDALHDQVMPLAGRLSAVETQLDAPIDIASDLDPALSPLKERLEALETKVEPVVHFLTGIKANVAAEAAAAPETPAPVTPVADAPEQATPGVAVPVATTPEVAPTV